MCSVGVWNTRNSLLEAVESTPQGTVAIISGGVTKLTLLCYAIAAILAIVRRIENLLT